jgi:hypothetical protein
MEIEHLKKDAGFPHKHYQKFFVGELPAPFPSPNITLRQK